MAMLLTIACIFAVAGLTSPVMAEPVVDKANKRITMTYDDYLDMSGIGTVGVASKQEATSKQVRVVYNGANGQYENQLTSKDPAVVSAEGNVLHAVGVGTAKISIGGSEYAVSVGSAPISLFLIIGQSNAEGVEGDAAQSIACESGQVYSSYGASTGGEFPKERLSVANAGRWVPSALTGINSTVAVAEGKSTEELNRHPVNALQKGGAGKIGMDSGIAYEWILENPGEKVWIVNAAHTGTKISTWQPNGTENNFLEAVTMFRAVQAVMDAEINAGHYTLNHMGYFWLQGCYDSEATAKNYIASYKTMHNGLKNQLAANIGKSQRTLEFGNMLLVKTRNIKETGAYRTGTYPADVIETKYFESFRDRQMTGPRVAQYYMGNSTEAAFMDVNLVCDIADDWVYGTDGKSNGVASYFKNVYPKGTFDYSTQSKAIKMPTTPADVHDSIHYNQVGYNEIGREAVRNTVKIMRGVTSTPKTEFLKWNGYEKVADNSSVTVGAYADSRSLLVPKVSPLYMSKKVSIEASDSVDASFYDHTLSRGNSGRIIARYGSGQIAAIDLTADGEADVSVAFDPGTQGELSETTRSFKVGEKYGKALPTPKAKPGYRFSAWFTASERGNAVNSDTQANRTVTKLYAKYAPEKRITYTWDFTEGSDLKTKEGNNAIETGTVKTGEGASAVTWGTDDVKSYLRVDNNGSQYLKAYSTDNGSAEKNRASALIGRLAAPIELPATTDWEIEYEREGIAGNDMVFGNDSIKDGQAFIYHVKANRFVCLGRYNKDLLGPGKAGFPEYGATAGDLAQRHTYKWKKTWDGNRNTISLYEDDVLVTSDINSYGNVSGNMNSPLIGETLDNNSFLNSDIRFTTFGWAGGDHPDRSYYSSLWPMTGKWYRVKVTVEAARSYDDEPHTDVWEKPIKKGEAYIVDGNRYRVISVANASRGGKVVLIKAKNARTVSVPKAIKLRDSRNYKVTGIAKQAFTQKKIRHVIIGASVVKLYKNAFRGSKVTTVTIKTKGLTKKGVNGSMKGSKVKKIKVSVGKKTQNKKYVKKYAKIFTKKNAGKKVKVK